ncbi:MAG: Uma2 family endonuclease [Cyanobacteria bacterium J06638_22]
MVASFQPPPNMTAEVYLDWETHQESRHEYVGGTVVAMTGGTIPHNDIALNFYTSLRSHLRTKGCRINVADVKVQISTQGPYYYPDVVISCAPTDLEARQFIQLPILIAEVLSPGTEANDRGKKFRNYQTLSSLQEYLLIDSEKMAVECYRRGEGRMWLYYPYGSGDIIRLDSLGFDCPVDVLYEGVQFESN